MSNSAAVTALQRRLRRIGSSGGGGSINGVPILFKYVNGDPLMPGSSFTRADATTCATFVDAQGLVQTVPANTLRQSHYINGIRTTLLEGSRANLALQNRDLTQAGTWTGSATSALKNATGVDGVANSASTLTEDGTNANHFIVAQIAKAASALVYAATFDVKPNGRNFVGLRLDDGAGNGTRVDFTLTGNGSAAAPVDLGTPFTSVTSRITALTGTNAGWYRCTVMATSNTAVVLRMLPMLESASGTTSYAGDGVSGARFDYVGLEQAAFESSRIATGAASVTRAVSVTQFPNGAAPQNLTLYVKLIDGGANGASVTNDLVLLGSAAGAAPYLELYSTSGKYLIAHNNGSATRTSTAAATTALGDTVELRAVLQADGSVFLGQSVNGAAEAVAATSAANTLQSAWSAALLNLSGYGGTSPTFAGMQAVKVLQGSQSLAVCRAA